MGNKVKTLKIRFTDEDIDEIHEITEFLRSDSISQFIRDTIRTKIWDIKEEKENGRRIR